MYIAPNSTVKVLNNIPLDASQENTIWFNTRMEQYTYFADPSRVKFTYDKQSYQRADRGYIRVYQNADNLYDCNYLMFQNLSYGERWFYAFIEGIEYINDNVTEIKYTIDDMQTWFMGETLTIEPCFVEREHPLTDNIGEHLVDEPIGIGDYVLADVNGVTHTPFGGVPGGTEWLDNWSIVVAKSSNPFPDVTIADLSFFGAVPQQCEFRCFKMNNLNDILAAGDFIKTYGVLNNSERILSIFLFPNDLIPDYVYNGNGRGYGVPTHGEYVAVRVPFNTSNIFSNYTVRNNKLFTHPYCFLNVENGQGSSVQFKWERFGFDLNGNAVFRVNGSLSTNPSMTLYANDYCGFEFNTNEKLVITNFPRVAYCASDFVPKMVQAVTQVALTAIGGAIGGAAGAAISGSSGALTKTTTRTVSDVKRSKPKNSSGRMTTYQSRELTDTKTTTSEREYENESKLGNAMKAVAATTIPHVSNNAVGDSNNALNVGDFDFTFQCLRITDEYAAIIDDFFDMYGYATNRVKVPNMNTRPHWNYVKTTNFNLHGYIPSDAIENIQKIFNAGITIWKYGNEVGDYSLDNRPVSNPT